MKRWDEICKRFSKAHTLRGAEVGVWRGDTSWRLLQKLPMLTLYMIDRWKPAEPDSEYAQTGDGKATASEKAHDDAWTAAHKYCEFAGDRAVFLPGETVEMAKHIKDHSLDFAFIDAEHTYNGVSADIRAYWPKINPGGWLCGHDWDHPDFPGVSEAVRDWIDNQYPQAYIELGGNRTWFIRRQGG